MMYKDMKEDNMDIINLRKLANESHINYKELNRELFRYPSMNIIKELGLCCGMTVYFICRERLDYIFSYYILEGEITNTLDTGFVLIKSKIEFGGKIYKEERITSHSPQDIFLTRAQAEYNYDRIVSNYKLINKE